MRPLMLKFLVWLCLIVPGVASAGWEYHAETDKMTSKEARYAIAESSNSLSLRFPYQGENHGRLHVRQHPKYGLDVFFTLEKGQLQCHSFDDQCGVMVRFDDAKPVRFAGTPSGDHDSRVIFIRDARRFIASAQKAERILVQALVFQNGEQVLEFRTRKPLEWDNKPKEKK